MAKQRAAYAYNKRMAELARRMDEQRKARERKRCVRHEIARPNG